MSLHAPNDELRSELVPLNKKYPIEELMDACVRYALRKRGTSVTFEYTLMKGVNDQPQHARELVRLLRAFDNAVQMKDAAKVNLIPFNPFPGTRFERPDDEAIRGFQKLLNNAGLIAPVRRTRGDDIDAACGQLKGQVMDRTRRQAEFRKRLQRAGSMMRLREALLTLLCSPWPSPAGCGGDKGYVRTSIDSAARFRAHRP